MRSVETVSDIPPARPLPQSASRRRFGRWMPWLVPLLLFPTTGAAESRDEDKEPVPPAIFFAVPDEPTRVEIGVLISNSFGDRNKVVHARELLLDRYRLLAVPQLVRELEGARSDRGKNQPGLLNSTLVVGAMRDAYGPSPHLWPALDPLLRVLVSQAVYERVFAALALGSWHWPEMTETRERPKAEGWAGSRDPTPKMKESLREAGRRLANAVRDDNPQVRKAAALALAKRGGRRSANELFDAVALRGPESVPEVNWAFLLARGFLRPRTPEAFFAPFLPGRTDNNLKRAAALSMSVAMLQEGPSGDLVPWVQDHAALLRTLKKAGVNPREGPEVVFARGVLAWKKQLTEEWPEIARISVDPGVNEQTAVAAAQALLFCGTDAFRKDVLRYALGEAKRAIPRDSVLAGYLLIATMQGTDRSIEAAARYLKNSGLRPKGGRAWDVRFHAAVGLARAFAAKRITGEGRRTAALDALRAGAAKLHKEAPFRLALKAWLDVEAPKIATDVNYRPSLAGVRTLESSFTCPYALLSRDLKEVCAHRANKFTLRILGAHNVQPPKAGAADKAQTQLLFLRSYLEAYPYFSRLEFLWERGARPQPGLRSGEVGIDR